MFDERNIPTAWWKMRVTCDHLMAEFRTRLLGLMIVFQEDVEQQPLMYSGIPVSIESQLFWLTSAHVINEIRGIYATRQSEIAALRWWDNSEIPGAETVPFHETELSDFVFDEDELDVGFVKISKWDATNILAAGDLKPFPLFDTQYSSRFNPTGYYLMGWAGEDVVYRSSDPSVSTSLTCLPVEQVDFEGRNRTGEFWSDPDAFYGQIVPYAGEPELPPLNVHGMSGGPILAVRVDKNGQIFYRLTGIQRSWDSQKMIVRAEPVEKIFEAI